MEWGEYPKARSDMTLDEAIALTLELLRHGRAQDYGYDLYPTRVTRLVAEQRHGNDRQALAEALTEMSPIFMEAAWELCRRGMVRPGIRNVNSQATDEGGYSLTIAGEAALDDLDETTILISQPGSLAATLAGYRGRLGEGFHQRAQEAINCRNAEAWLACCAMVGAAAESVLLALAIAKTGDEDDILRRYRQAGGRQKVLNVIVGQANQITRDTLTTFSNIISFWRNEAAHGRASPIGTANADEALRQLLHMCQWVDREWAALTA